jgi:hypothetical protein
MTILLKILGYSWLVLSAAVSLIVYGFIWMLEGHRAVASTFLGGGAFSSIGVGVMVLPGVALIAMGLWMDRPRRAR